VFPEDGFTAHAWTYVDWINVAIQHAQANNLPIPEPSKMEEQLCMTLPPGWCSYDAPNRTSTVLEWKDVLRGAESLARFMANGMQQVDQAEADRRARICSMCYLNVPMSGCSACQAAVNKLASGMKSKHDATLKSCAVCKCVLKMKVHFPISILDKETENVKNQYKAIAHCWLNKSSENYHGHGSGN
jgi:hypothetical protein